MADQCQWAEGSKKSLHHIFSYPPKKSLINGQIGGSFPYIEISQYVVEEVGGEEYPAGIQTKISEEESLAACRLELVFGNLHRIFTASIKGNVKSTRN